MWAPSSGLRAVDADGQVNLEKPVGLRAGFSVWLAEAIGPSVHPSLSKPFESPAMLHHPSLRRIVPAALLPLFSATALHAQDTPPDFPSILPVRSEILHDEDNGSHWALGRTYKAHFGPDGATYIPFLGADVPRNFPVRMTVAGNRLGAAQVGLEAPVVERDAERISIDRGAVRAEYILTPQFVEQLFVIDERPQGEGDLIVQLDVESELFCQSQDNGLAFENEWGGRRYGAAVVLDAAGRRASLPVEFTQSSITLRIPTAFLTAATYPLAIDPLLSTNRITTTSGSSEFHPDVVWDPVAERYLVVYEIGFSGQDHDVMWFEADANGPISGTESAIDISNLYARGPQVAAIPQARQACAVYSSGFAGSRNINYLLRNLDSGQRSFLFALTSSSFDEFRPDVGGAATSVSADQRFSVVYEVEETSAVHSIRLRQVLPNTVLLGLETLIHRAPQVIAQTPVISSSIPDGQLVHNVAWSTVNPSSYSIVTRQVHAHGFNLTTSSTILDTKLVPLANPDVTAVGPRVGGEAELGYVVAWQQRRTSATGNVSIKLALCAGDELISLHDQEAMANANPDHNQAQPAVAANASGFALAYGGAPDSPDNHDIYMCGFSVANRELALAERRVVASANSGHDETPRVVSHYESGAPMTTDTFAAVFTQRVLTIGGNRIGDLRLAEYEAEQACGVQQENCFSYTNSTGEGAMLSIAGQTNNFSPRTMRVVGLRPQSIGLFLTSRSLGGFVVPPGSSGQLCLGGDIGRMQIVTATSAGLASMTLDPSSIERPVGTASAQPGESWFFQLWHRDVSAGQATSNFSNAAKLPFE